MAGDKPQSEVVEETAAGASSNGQSAAWWEKQANRYKEETSAIARQLDELKAQRNSEAEGLRTQLHQAQRDLQTAEASHASALEEARQATFSALRLAEQRRTALADVMHLVGDVITKVSPLLAE